MVEFSEISLFEKVSDFYPYQSPCGLQGQQEIKLYSESPPFWTSPAKKTCWQSGIPYVNWHATLYS